MNFLKLMAYFNPYIRGAPGVPGEVPGGEKTTNNTVRGRGSARAFVIPMGSQGPQGCIMNTPGAPDLNE